MEEDFIWFKEHYPEFQKEYGEAFIVIKNKKVLGAYESYAKSLRETAKTEELGTFINQTKNTRDFSHEMNWQR